MKRSIVILFFTVTAALGQTPQVPERMEFAGIRLTIDDPARREIQESVDALTANPRYFNVHVQRARSYFPIIERVFREENLPEDFKYLVLQESALLPDAVSSSDAVGFWQFKDFTAQEMGLRVDRQVDERMNIVSSSRAAARYMKKNNERFFDNWLISLMAYQMGPGAAIKAGGEKYKGQKSMQIDRRTYWYIKKFLAHKIAFESFVDGPAELSFVELINQQGKSLDDIAREASLSPEKVSDYNKWLRRGSVPDDRTYTILLPVVEGKQPMVAAVPEPAAGNSKPEKTSSPVRTAGSESPGRNYDITDPSVFPLYDDRAGALSGKITDINDRPAVVARRNDRVATLAGRGGISVSRFLNFNDMKDGDRVQEGQVYYLKKKASKPRAYYHVAAKGEDLWDISQKYGLRLSKLKQRNRIRTASNKVEEGMILWLRYIRPSDVPVEFKRTPVKKEAVVKVSPEAQKEKTASESPVTTSRPSAGEGSRDSEQSTAQPPVEKREWGSGDKPSGSDSPVKPTTIPAGEEDNAETDKLPVAHRRITHRVKQGETYYAISRQYEVSVQDVLDWNDLKINDPLSIGQELIIRKPVIASGNPENSGTARESAVPEKETTYEVKSGDTLYGIARKFNLTVSELKKLNAMSGDTIKPGDKLKVSR